MRQNRPTSTDLASGSLLPEREARSIFNGIGQYSHYSNNIVSSSSPWVNDSWRGERSIEHEPQPLNPLNITLYSHRHYNECLLHHDMYDAKGNTDFDKTSVVEDNKLPEAVDWENEICCDIVHEKKGKCTKADKDLSQRVRKILDRGLAGICNDHLVCEIFSPEDLQNIAGSYTTCRTAVSKWWKRFHRLFVSIRNFEELYQPKFDSFQSDSNSDTFTYTNSKGYTYQTDYNFTKCKVRQFKAETQQIFIKKLLIVFLFSIMQNT